MSDKKRGNGLIELYRFMFCMAVLFFHAEKYFLGEPGKLGAFKPYFFVHGAVGVEFFFVCQESGNRLRADVGRHDDNRIGKVDGVSLVVGQTPIVQNL